MTTEPKPSTYDNSALTAEDEGYHKGLKPRQLQMIAIGGAIGTGLFLGAGGRLASAGPALFLVYAFCGVFVFLILRALGELVLQRAVRRHLSDRTHRTLRRAAQRRRAVAGVR